MLRDIINENKVRWYDMDKLDNRDAEIQKIITQLDEVAVEYEKKWGIGVLPKECTPAMREKWDKQGEKFQAAMLKKDVDLVRDLASGYKRAYKALEEDCLGQGKEPKDTSYFEHVIGEKHIIVCQTYDDVRIMVARQPKADIWSMAQIASIIDKDHDLLKTIDKSLSEKVESKELDPFDFSVGDAVEF